MQQSARLVGGDRNVVNERLVLTWLLGVLYGGFIGDGQIVILHYGVMTGDGLGTLT